MAYQFLVNQTPANGAEAIVALKDTLKAAGWTLKKASDGTTMSAADPAPDPVTTAYLANPSAWFVLRQPSGGTGAHAGTREIAFQRGANNTQWRVTYSYSGGFSSGGDATHIGSAGDEQEIFPRTGSNVAPAYDTLFAADGSYRFSIAAENAAPFQWYAFGFPTGVNTGVYTAIFFDGMKTGTFPTSVDGGADDDPFVLYAVYLSSGGSLAINRLSSGYYAPLGWMKKNTVGAGFVRVPMCWLESYSDGMLATALGVNPHNEKDDLFDFVYARRAALGAPSGYKGVSSLVQYRGTVRNFGELVVSGGNTYINLEDTVMPWPAATSLLI